MSIIRLAVYANTPMVSNSGTMSETLIPLRIIFMPCPVDIPFSTKYSMKNSSCMLLSLGARLLFPLMFGLYVLMFVLLVCARILSTKNQFICGARGAMLNGKMKVNPDFSIERACGMERVAGCDEAGRGPLCGPVVAAAVMFPSFDIDIPVVIRDSKQMTHAQRAAAYDWIVANTQWAVAQCGPDEIDELNILWASMRAMERAVAGLGQVPEFCLVDGNRVPAGLTGAAVVKGDAKSLSIAAASILAKETRDRIMLELAHEFPEYGWDKNAGYPTKTHLQAIEKYGITKHHRKTFGPVKERIKNETSHD